MKRGAVLLGAGLILGGCSSEPPGPTAATLELALQSPAQDDGAVLMTISGGPIDSIEAPGYRVYSTSVEGGRYRVIVAGALVPGPMARIHIPNRDRAADYSAVIDQVAARTSYTQRDPAGYRLHISP